MTEDKKENIGDSAQESLVQALESIKGLLEKSESKLSAARESIALANDCSKRSKFKREEEIPVLNDIVMADNITSTQPDLDLSSGEIVLPEPEAIVEPEPLIPQGIDCDDVIDLVNEFQQRIKPLLNEAITNSSILKMEQVLNDVLEKELHQLRNEIKQLDN